MISCSEYDHIEIVCMFNYPVTLSLRSGELVSGSAVDTRRNTNREECIVVNIDNEERLIVLDTIARLDVNRSNPHFQTISFK
jgi:Rho-binding antiterminator